MADEKVGQGSTEETRQQMSDTRASLAEKLDTLEKQVGETVQDATQSVVTVKETVQETVESVKDTVQDTVQTVKETVHDTVATVKDFLDIGAHVERNPWIMMAGGVAVGFISGRLLHAGEDQAPPSGHELQPASGGRHNGRSRRHEARMSEPPTASLAAQFAPEMSKLKSLAMGTIFGLLRDWLEPKVPEALKPQVTEILGGISQKLGAEVPTGTILPEEAKTGKRGDEFSAESRFSG